MNSPLVVIIGRPNVGKSTLFNRLIGRRDAIVDNVSGVTRDRVYGEADWNGKTFQIIDTGGYVPDSEDVFETAIREQVEIAIDEADCILFVVDVRDGINPMDTEIMELLRTSGREFFLIVNKYIDLPSSLAFDYRSIHQISLFVLEKIDQIKNEKSHYFTEDLDLMKN